MAMGNAVAIIIGQLLGAGKMEEAKDTDTKLITFAVFTSVLISMVLMVTAPLFPRLYNTSDSVKSLATALMRVAALYMPVISFMHATYFTLRSGGKTIITFLFDSVYLWVISIPLAYVLSRFTEMPILLLYLCVQMVDILKATLGFILVKKGVWINNIVAD